MKNFCAAFILAFTLFSCHETCVEPFTCNTPATVRDLTGQDGCGWAFELSDGTKLVAMVPVIFCGTPPLPKEVTEDPLYNFEWTDGKKVYISYDEVEGADICMAGPLVKITCISDRLEDTGE